MTKFYTFVNRVLKQITPNIDPKRMVLAPHWFFDVHSKMRSWPQYANLQRERAQDNPELD